MINNTTYKLNNQNKDNNMVDVAALDHLDCLKNLNSPQVCRFNKADTEYNS